MRTITFFVFCFMVAACVYLAVEVIDARIVAQTQYDELMRTISAKDAEVRLLQRQLYAVDDRRRR